jgi:hypothetical protein
MKVIFLDHDGVICLSSEWGSRFKNKEGLDAEFDRFNQKAIKVLNQILDETDAEIVISSDWRFHCTLEQMQELYKIRGIRKSPIDFTSHIVDINGLDYLEHNRQMEIKQWLSEHPEVTHWVAVDDLNMGPEYCRKWGGSDGLTNFVHTPRSYEGIKQSGIKDKIIKYLKD